MRILTGIGRFLWDFIIGEDWKIAAGVAVVLAAGALLVAGTSLSNTAICLIVGCGILGVATAGIVAGALAAAKAAGK
jgi:hypothetical protein